MSCFVLPKKSTDGADDLQVSQRLRSTCGTPVRYPALRSAWRRAAAEPVATAYPLSLWTVRPTMPCGRLLAPMAVAMNSLSPPPVARK